MWKSGAACRRLLATAASEWVFANLDKRYDEIYDGFFKGTNYLPQLKEELGGTALLFGYEIE